MILNTFLAILVALGVAEAGTPLTSCYAGSAYTSFVETPISISTTGCKILKKYKNNKNKNTIF
jgi:hypothetical protein